MTEIKKLIADLREPRLGIHGDGTEELKTWEQLWEQCQRAADALSLQSENTARDAVIEEVAKSIEAAPLTYAGPDPHVASDLRYLIVAAIRDMKKPL